MISLEAVFFLASLKSFSGAERGDKTVPDATNASEAFRETRFAFRDLDGDEFLSGDEIPDSDLRINSTYTSLEEYDGLELSEPAFVLDGRIGDVVRFIPGMAAGLVTVRGGSGRKTRAGKRKARYRLSRDL